MAHCPARGGAFSKNINRTYIDNDTVPRFTPCWNEARRGQVSRYGSASSTHPGRSRCLPAARQPHRGACPLCHGLGNHGWACTRRDRCRPPLCSWSSALQRQCRDRRHPVAPGVRSPGRKVCTRGSLRNRWGSAAFGLPSRSPRETGEAPAARRAVLNGPARRAFPGRTLYRDARRPSPRKPVRGVRGSCSTGTWLQPPAGEAKT